MKFKSQHPFVFVILGLVIAFAVSATVFGIVIGGSKTNNVQRFDPSELQSPTRPPGGGGQGTIYTLDT